MFSTLIKTVALASMAQLAAADLNFVFGNGHFAGLSGSSGHFTGFSLITSEGKQVFDGATINGYTPCRRTPASRIEASSSCWEGPITIHCRNSFGGIPESCSADYVGNHFDGDATKDTKFIGISIGIDGHCGGSVTLDTSHCTGDDHVTFKYPT